MTNLFRVLWHRRRTRHPLQWNQGGTKQLFFGVANFLSHCFYNQFSFLFLLFYRSAIGLFCQGIKKASPQGRTSVPYWRFQASVSSTAQRSRVTFRHRTISITCRQVTNVTLCAFHSQFHPNKLSEEAMWTWQKQSEVRLATPACISSTRSLTYFFFLLPFSLSFVNLLLQIGIN